MVTTMSDPTPRYVPKSYTYIDLPLSVLSGLFSSVEPDTVIGQADKMYSCPLVWALKRADQPVCYVTPEIACMAFGPRALTPVLTCFVGKIDAYGTGGKDITAGKALAVLAECIAEQTP